ncbi:F-box associated domain type 3 [Arabidopsis thaliana x Arabidopsis arenosa]|uniref:F-box associated domain type 3 n=1 Tax=Arabidopsis thaliana x Arabidopsis arenosa TaxID=1240361 RepID=A0A8T2A3E8_9BRAS|nr:F-box associated domain type 3 [Arabidopsis thaliana x Arabidopsis arenosa]KAG7567135.1 F-box associated domain type 3 [Arabidopsis thaliana x Arabidopsis arenosa]
MFSFCFKWLAESPMTAGKFHRANKTTPSVFSNLRNGSENGKENAKSCGVWSFFSSPQLENPYEKSSSTLVAAAEFHVKFSPDNLRINHYYDLKYFSIGYASGLIYLYGNRGQARPVICNPITGRYAILPDRYTYRKAYSFFGFDPIDKQYKVLSMVYPSGPGDSKILTFGAGDMMTWRKINCLLRHDVKSEGVCINGVLYYLGDTSDWGHVNDSHDVTSDYVIVCFDVRSETFTFIDVERFCRLINYKGKLAVIYWEDDVDIYELYYEEGIDVDKYMEDNVDADAINELRLWILEDVEKQEWSKYAYTWSDDKFFRRLVSIGGVTASGEIVFSMRKYTPTQPFYVFYINPERNTLQRVEIQGFGEGFKKTCSVCTFVNHVEDLNANDLEQLQSVHPPLESD